MWLFLFLFNFLLATSVESGNLENAPEFKDYRGGGRLAPAWDEQVIVPSYRIARSGKVVFWAAYVHSRFGQNTDYRIEFQVWRRSVGECYSLVNSSTMPPTRPYRHQVNLTLQDPEQFSVQVGDVVGYLQSEGGKGVQVLRGVGGYISLEDHSLTESLQECGYPARSHDVRVLRSSSSMLQGSPIITLSVREVNMALTSSAMPVPTTLSNNTNPQTDNVALAVGLTVGAVVFIALVVAVVCVIYLVWYKTAGRAGGCLRGDRDASLSSSQAVTYNRQGRRRENPYHSETESSPTPDRTPDNEREWNHEPTRVLSYVDPVDTLMNQPHLLPERYLVCGSSAGSAAPKYEDPKSFPGSSHSPKLKCKQYSTGYSAVFLRAGTYVPTLEERVCFNGSYEVQHPMKYKHQYNKLSFFKEDTVYWAPATTASGLYAQLSAKRYREIPREQLRLLEKIGSGNFATICKGLWMYENESMLVAVKKLRENASDSDQVRFLQEAAIMGQFWHPEVVSLHGVVTVGDPCLIVLEYAPNGDLLKYLRGVRITNRGDSGSHAELQKQFLGFATEVASAMAYLSRKRFVHRDLAARNILLDAHLKCRIADFGLTRHLTEDGYYDSGRGKIPVKWTAPEALLYQRYSTASDVWSFGMVLYEMWALGLPPFRNTSIEVIIAIHNRRRGYCLPPPPGTPRAIYTFMVKCWHPEPRERLTFWQLYQSLCQPEEYLLSWPEEEEELPALARQLGADHAHSQNLHTDLQNKYCS